MNDKITKVTESGLNVDNYSEQFYSINEFIKVLKVKSYTICISFISLGSISYLHIFKSSYRCQV